MENLDTRVAEILASGKKIIDEVAYDLLAKEVITLIKTKAESSHTHSATTAAHTHTQTSHAHNIRASQDFDGNCVGIANPHYNDIKFGGSPKGTAKYTNKSTNSSAELVQSTTATIGNASPTTSIGSTGSGTAFSIMPPYLVVNIWKRLS